MFRALMIGSLVCLSTLISTTALAGSGSCELTSGLEFEKPKRVDWVIRRDYGPLPVVPLATWGEGDRYSPLYEAEISGVQISLKKNFGGINITQSTFSEGGGSYGGNVYPISTGRLYVWSGKVQREGKIEVIQIWCDVVE